MQAPPAPPPQNVSHQRGGGGPIFLGRGAFSSYVRNRGEPDGARASTSEQKGRESDAAFTPSPVDSAAKYARGFRSPPQGPPSDQGSPQPSPRLALTLAHQNKIRSMYTSTSPASDNGGKRPDSSSSTSSMTDWESGQATVRRQPLSKQGILKPPPPASSRVSDVSAGFSRPPLVSLNKSNSQASSGFESQSSDSDFGPKRTGTVRSVYTTVGSATTLKLTKNASMDTLDRLSVRTEVGKPNLGNTRGRRDSSNDRELSSKEQKEPKSTSSTMTTSHSSTHSNPNDGRKTYQRKAPDFKLDASIGKLLRPRTNYTATIHENDSVYGYRSGDDMTMKMGQKSIQDHIASQLSRLNREMPISDVYHERNLGLGLAPPLSKLLMSATQPMTSSEHGGDTESKSASEDSFGNFDKLSLVDENQLALPPKPDFKPKPPPIPPKRFGPKPWVSAHPHVTNVGVSIDDGSEVLPSGIGLSAELSRRDEGDGRSMTDSHYSGYSPSRNNGVKSDVGSLPPKPPPRNYYNPKRDNPERENDTLAILNSRSGHGARSSDSHALPTVADLHPYAAFNPAYEHDEPLSVGAVGTMGPRIGSTEIAEYMEQVLGSSEPSENDPSEDGDAKSKTCKRSGKHSSSAWGKRNHKPYGHHSSQSSSC